MKTWKRAMVFLFALLMVCLVTACSSVKVSGDLVIKSDGTGTRKIQGVIDKVSYDTDNGVTYYYLKKHGDDLEAWLRDVYTKEVPGSEEWLDIKVVDGAASEVVTLSFDFTSFEEYATRLKALAYDETKNGAYVDPVITVADGKITAYAEEKAVMDGIMKSIHNTFLGDDTIYDDACTGEDGESLNGGASEGIVASNGIEFIGADKGPILKIQVDGGKVGQLYTEGEETGVSYTVPEDAEPADDPADEPAKDAAGISTTEIILSVVIAVVAIIIIVLIVLGGKKKKAE